MESSVEKRLQGLLPPPGNGPSSAREVLYRDVLLLQLAKQVGASLRGIYDDENNLRSEELAHRIRAAAPAQGEAKRAQSATPSRQRSNPRIRPAWFWAGLILGPTAALAAIAALAVRLGLLPGP